MTRPCANPACDQTVRRDGARCPACAHVWRLARQRQQRGAAEPVGPLAAETTAELVAILAVMRDDLDADERDLQRLIDGDPTEATVLAILNDVIRRTRARLTDLRVLTSEWESIRRDVPPKKPDAS